jgi:hypothetical protein
VEAPYSKSDGRSGASRLAIAFWSAAVLRRFIASGQRHRQGSQLVRCAQELVLNRSDSRACCSNHFHGRTSYPLRFPRRVPWCERRSGSVLYNGTKLYLMIGVAVPYDSSHALTISIKDTTCDEKVGFEHQESAEPRASSSGSPIAAGPRVSKRSVLRQDWRSLKPLLPSKAPFSQSSPCLGLLRFKFRRPTLLILRPEGAFTYQPRAIAPGTMFIKICSP